MWMAIQKPKSPENTPENIRKMQKSSNLLKKKNLLNTDI